MRAKEFVFETQDYKAPFNNMIGIAKAIGADRIENVVNSVIEYAKTALKRQDRITWYLRHEKFMLLRYLYGELLSFVQMQTDVEKKEYAKKILQKLEKKDLPELQKKLKFGTATPLSFSEYRQNSVSLENSVDHWVSLDPIIPEAKNTVWQNQSGEEMQSYFANLERNWREKNRSLVELQDGDKEFLKITPNQSWWLLDREYCREEGSAMGHCGNTASYNRGDRILSYRTRVTDTLLKPHLTFILHQNGYLGEMKGRANEKPNPRYHPAIIELLKKTEIIKGISGGGYAPQNNFSINDLDESDAEKLLQINPNLISFSEMIERYGIHDRNVRMRALDFFENAGIERESESLVITPEKVDANFIIGSWGSVSDLSANGTFEWALRVLQGDEHFDYWDVPVYNDQISDLLESYGKKHNADLEKIKDYLRENHEYDEEEYSDWIEFVIDNEVDSIIDVAKTAIRIGMEMGTESEMYEDFMQAIKNSGLRFEGHPMDASFELVVSLDELLGEIQDYDSIEEVVDHLTEQFEIELEEPYGGWNGYDEEAAIADFADRLFDEVL